MTTWLYNLPTPIAHRLFVEMPGESVRIVRNLHAAKDLIKPSDHLVCMWANREIQKAIGEIDASVFPARPLLELFGSRARMTRVVDACTAFPAERVYHECEGVFTATVPRLTTSLQVVAKVGEAHQGDDKYLLYPGRVLQAEGSIIFEEFVRDALSIRILIIDTGVFVLEYQDDPNAPRPSGNEWIKNVNPIIVRRTNTDRFKPLIDDALLMSEALGYDYLGVDYVIGKEKTICLEINPFPGVSDPDAFRAAVDYWRNKITEWNDKEDTAHGKAVCEVGRR